MNRFNGYSFDGTLFVRCSQIYDLWSTIRETRLNEELDRVNRFRRVRELERITAEMAEKEERLWFFENEDKIDLEIERNENEELKKGPVREKKTNKRDIDENYVPPEIGATRTQN